MTPDWKRLRALQKQVNAGPPDSMAALNGLLGEVLLFAYAVREVADKPPVKPTFDHEAETLGPVGRARKQRHKDFIQCYAALGYDLDGETIVHPGGARFELRQIIAAWDRRSNSEILAVMAWVRRRPKIVRELWRPQ